MNNITSGDMISSPDQLYDLHNELKNVPFETNDAVVGMVIYRWYAKLVDTIDGWIDE